MVNNIKSITFSDELIFTPTILYLNKSIYGSRGYKRMSKFQQQLVIGKPTLQITFKYFGTTFTGITFFMFLWYKEMFFKTLQMNIVTFFFMFAPTMLTSKYKCYAL